MSVIVFILIFYIQGASLFRCFNVIPQPLKNKTNDAADPERNSIYSKPKVTSSKPAAAVANSRHPLSAAVGHRLCG